MANDRGVVESSPSADLFVSHSSDDREIVGKIVSYLKQAGITAFCSTFDQRASTRDYERDLQDRLNKCLVVLGLLSKNALKSEWVQSEWNAAWWQDKIMFVRIEDVKAGLHARYRRKHYGDLSKWSGLSTSAEWIRLIEDIEAELKSRRASVNDETDSKEKGKDFEGDPAQDGEAGPSPNEPNFPIVGQDFGTIDAVVLPQPLLPSEQLAIGDSSLSEDPQPPLEVPLDLGLDGRDWDIANGIDLVRKALSSHSFAELHQTARTGQVDAQAVVGIAYQVGAEDVPADYGAAGRWLERAAAGGWPRAQAELAVLIASGRFGSFDLKHIDALTSEAAATGNARARTLRALLRLTGTRLPSLPYDKVSGLLEQAHEAGDLLATTQLGWGLLQGLGMRRDARRGFELLQQASQAGDARAMAYLGIAYARGRGVRRDRGKAAHWFDRSARRNDPMGQFYLAWCHETGVGVARDAGEARKLYMIAADRGDADAQIRLARMLIDGRGGVADFPGAVRLLEAASGDGDVGAEAMALLAELLEEGRGVPRDLARAVALYEKAGAEDHPRALWSLGKLFEEGRGVGRDRERAIQLFRRAAFNATNKSFFLMVVKRLDLLGAPLRRDVR